MNFQEFDCFQLIAVGIRSCDWARRAREYSCGLNLPHVAFAALRQCLLCCAAVRFDAASNSGVGLGF